MSSKPKERPWEKAKLRDAIKCPTARRVYPFQLSPDSHTGPANEKPTHANCQLGSLSVIWKHCQNLVCIISHISRQPALGITRRGQRRGRDLAVTFDFIGQPWLLPLPAPISPPFEMFSSFCISFALVSAWVDLHVCVCVRECVKAYTPQWLVAGKWEEGG